MQTDVATNVPSSGQNRDCLKIFWINPYVTHVRGSPCLHNYSVCIPEPGNKLRTSTVYHFVLYMGAGNHMMRGWLKHNDEL